jgi:hypothetical protein
MFRVMKLLLAMGMFAESFPINSCLCWLYSSCLEQICHIVSSLKLLVLSSLRHVTMEREHPEVASAPTVPAHKLLVVPSSFGAEANSSTMSSHFQLSDGKPDSLLHDLQLKSLYEGLVECFLAPRRTFCFQLCPLILLPRVLPGPLQPHPCARMALQVNFLLSRPTIALGLFLQPSVAPYDQTQVPCQSSNAKIVSTAASLLGIS